MTKFTGMKSRVLYAPYTSHIRDMCPEGVKIILNVAYRTAYVLIPS